MFGYTYGETDKGNNSHGIQSLAVLAGGGRGAPIYKLQYIGLCRREGYDFQAV